MTSGDFDESVIAASESLFGETTNAGYDSLVGQIIVDRWEILERLGSGGLTIVYKAMNLSTKKLVAMKAIRDDLVSNARLVQRFQQEAQATAVLKHPNVMSVQDCFVTRDGRAFLIMDYVEGESLSDMLARSRRVAAMQAARILLQTADAVAYAHSKGVLHCDLRPSNIMVEKLSSSQAHQDAEQVRVVDFGFAKLFSGEDAELAGHAISDSPYASPEQVDGKEIDARSDIFSLGCVMYETLTGKAPFRTHASSNILFEKPPTFAEVLGAQSIKEDGLLRRLESVTMKALEKRPQDRFKSMKAMASAIEKAVTESGGMSRGDISVIKRGQTKQVQFSWNKLTISLVAILSIFFASSILLVWGWFKTQFYEVEVGMVSEPVSRNTRPIAAVQKDAPKTVMQNIDAAESYMSEAQKLVEKADATMQELRAAQKGGATPERQVEIYSVADGHREQAKRAYREAARYFGNAHRLLLEKPNDQLDGKIALRAADAYSMAGEMDNAKKCFKEAASIFKNYGELVAKCNFYIGHIELLQGHWEQANEAFEAALKTAKQPALLCKIKKDYSTSLWNTDQLKSWIVRYSMIPDLSQ